MDGDRARSPRSRSRSRAPFQPHSDRAPVLHEFVLWQSNIERTLSLLEDDTVSLDQQTPHGAWQHLIDGWGQGGFSITYHYNAEEKKAALHSFWPIDHTEGLAYSLERRNSFRVENDHRALLFRKRKQ